MRMTTTAVGVALSTALLSVPALARHDDGAPFPATYAPPVQAAFPVDRALAERCGLRAGSMRPHLLPADYFGDGIGPRRRDDGRGGALIGGAIGGIVGNRVAGHGDRTVGTIAGAAVGAVAGVAIDKAEDAGRANATPDIPPPGAAGECDAVLPPGYMLVAVPGGQECRDEVITHEEWVPEYVTVPARAAPRTKLRRAN